MAGGLGDQYGRQAGLPDRRGLVRAGLAAVRRRPELGVLIAARALQGVGAALLTPGSLAILEASFVPEDRGKAIGAWSGLSGVATAIGPFLGGWLVQAASWRLIFLINVPVAAAVVVVARRHVPESRDPDASGRIDVVGGLFVTGGLVGLTYGLIEGPGSGWTAPTVLAALVGGVVLLAGFVGWERRTPAPMLPLSLFTSTQFTATNLVTFVVYGALGGALFLLPIQLQQVAGYSPLQAGTSLLPVTVLMLALSARSGALAARIGPRLQMSLGPVLVGAGLALLARVDGSGNYLTEVFPAVVVFGLGLAATVAPLTATVLAAAPAEPRRHRLRRQQRRRPRRRTDRGGRASRRGRHHRRRLPGPGRVLGRVPHGVVHLCRAVRARRRTRRRDRPQPPPAGRPGTAAPAALRTGRTGITRRPAPMTSAGLAAPPGRRVAPRKLTVSR